MRQQGEKLNVNLLGVSNNKNFFANKILVHNRKIKIIESKKNSYIKIFDFIFYVSYQSGKRNGFKDYPSLYGKLILSAVLFLLHISVLNVLLYLGYSNVNFITKLSSLFSILGLILILVFLIYNQYRIGEILNQFNLKDNRIKLYFNIILLLSFLVMFITTVMVGPETR